MLQSVLQPAIALIRKDFFEALLSRRLQAVSVLIGVFLIAASTVLAFVSATRSSGATEPTEPFEVWFKGANGVLTGIAFGLVPIALPFLPILTSSRILQKEQNQGILHLVLTKPVPPWGPAAGKIAGLYAALAIPTVAISLGTAMAVGLVAGAYADVGLVLSFSAANVVLIGLYLVLMFALGTFVPQRSVPSLIALIWVGFNLVRQTSANMAARLLTILGEEVEATFQVAWSDLATFTGLYQALLAPSVPGNLAFVTPPGSAGSLDAAAQAVPWALLAWFVVLFVLHALFLRGLPSR